MKILISTIEENQLGKMFYTFDSLDSAGKKASHHPYSYFVYGATQFSGFSNSIVVGLEANASSRNSGEGSSLVKEAEVDERKRKKWKNLVRRSGRRNEIVGINSSNGSLEGGGNIGGGGKERGWWL
uniref:Uncharacterized protein n=1 Tax=Salix viminalis TaxID=40686 RepID=A0A6N2LIM4_SALVM